MSADLNNATTTFNERGGRTKKLNKLMLITNDTLKTIIMIFAHTFYGHFFSSEFQNFRIPGDILSIRYTQRESKENYANDVVLIFN